MFGARRTEHPQLIIIVRCASGFYLQRDPDTKSVHDLMLFINVKFIYVNKICEKNFRTIAHAMATTKCETDRAMRIIQCSLDSVNLEEFALDYSLGRHDPCTGCVFGVRRNEHPQLIIITRDVFGFYL